MSSSVAEYLRSLEMVEAFRDAYFNDKHYPKISSPEEMRLLYDGFARYYGAPLPEGEMDFRYAYNNIPYVINAWEESPWYVTREDCVYRLHICFTGYPPVLTDDEELECAADSPLLPSNRQWRHDHRRHI